MKVATYIKQIFPSGLPYDEAAQLCLRLYCTLVDVPENLHENCTKEGLSESFALLASKGFINGDVISSVIYGANFHDINDKGHWLEVIASTLKSENDILDKNIRKKLDERITYFNQERSHKNT